MAVLDAIHSLCGLEQFCYMLADYPEVVDASLEARAQASVKHAHAVARLRLSPVA